MGAKKRLVVIGAGGFAREVAWLAEDINRQESTFEFVGFVISDLSALGDYDSRDQVLGDYDWLESNRNRVDALAIGIGNPKWRRKVGLELKMQFPDLEWPSMVHPNVVYDQGSCRFGRGTLVCAGTIATVNVTLEDFSMVNLACTLGHESRIGEGSVLNPTVNISGGVVLEEGVLVGTGAQILQYVRVGEGATVGAGAVVNKDVPSDTTVVGIPAKPMFRRK